MSVHETSTWPRRCCGPATTGTTTRRGCSSRPAEPALVVRPRDPDEVAAALRHAVRHDLAVSVRSGGHSPLGHSTNTGGMVIDLAHLDAVEVLDADRRLVRVGGGATWGQVAAALDPHGWALTAGDTPTSGSAGSPSAAGSAGWCAGTAWPSTTWSGRGW